MKKSSPPLIIGANDDEIYFASCESVLIGKASKSLFLKDGEYGYALKDSVELFLNGVKLNPAFKTLEGTKTQAQKAGYKYFMEKEIYEQSAVLADAMMGRVRDGKIVLEELKDFDTMQIDEITICACGTSYHSALAASYIFERQAKIKCRVEIASEFRYKEPILRKNTLFIVVSQSGETADTLEALKIAKNAGLKTLAICNVDHSAIVREADNTILTRAGIEKGVASTKAFATQTLALWMLAIWFGQKTGALTDISKECDAMVDSTKATTISSELREKLHRLSKRYLHGHGFFFIGRDIFYPLALEGALKLKEISYLHAEGYPAGEMKHGPIALADARLFTIALAPKTVLFEKTKSNIEELSARDSTICAISPEVLEIADDSIQTRAWNHPMLEFFEMMTVVQLLALEIAVRLGADVDMPRNLAKSVTVE
jgi:glucosamine--fructose-6-phosphate aminotransferase (isomerizing)